jgi:putative hemolysin
MPKGQGEWSNVPLFKVPGMAPFCILTSHSPPQLFKEYVQLELQLGDVARCRTLYGKYLEWSPANCAAWTAYAELEASLGEEERARGIYELAVAQPSLDMPEALWKAYISFEMGMQVTESNRCTKQGESTGGPSRKTGGQTEHCKGLPDA